MPRLIPDIPFPPYAFVPGQGPHPVSDPAGHSFGQEAPVPEPLDPAQWQLCRPYLFGIDLFNHGYCWEAHEAWESLWHAAGRRGTIADFLKGLIKLAAAGVKHREGKPGGVQSHARRAAELFSQVASELHPQTCFAGLDLSKLIEASRHLAASEFFPIVLTCGAGFAQDLSSSIGETSCGGTDPCNETENQK